MKNIKSTILGAFIAALLLVVPLWVLADVTITITILPMVTPTVIANPATNITHISGTLQGEITKTGNNDPSVRGFVWGFSMGNYTQSWNETGSFGVGTFSYTVTNLTTGIQVFYVAFAINTIGRTNSTEMSFWPLMLPLAPTDFTITQTGASSINLTWVKGVEANATIIRGSSNGYPTSETDGYLVYNGTDIIATVEGLDLDTTSYYYSAWSWNSYGYSVDYATTSLEGGNPQMVIGIILIVIVLTVVAYVLKNPIIHMICVPAWLVLGVFLWNSTWPSGNTYLPTAVLALTILVAIAHLAMTIRHYLGLRTTPLTHADIQGAYKKQIRDLTAPKDKDFWP